MRLSQLNTTVMQTIYVYKSGFTNKGLFVYQLLNARRLSSVSLVMLCYVAATDTNQKPELKDPPMTFRTTIIIVSWLITVKTHKIIVELCADIVRLKLSLFVEVLQKSLVTASPERVDWLNETNNGGVEGESFSTQPSGCFSMQIQSKALTNAEGMFISVDMRPYASWRIQDLSTWSNAVVITMTV